MAQSTILKGLQISKQIPFRDPDALFALAGTDGAGKNAYLPVGIGMLNQHMLLLGEGGVGKTNMLLHLARNLRANLTPEDCLVLFDPAGMVHQALYQMGDTVLASDERAGTGQETVRWNLFQELSEARLLEDASALCDNLFQRRIAEAGEPFYGTAARDLTMALIVYLKRRGDPELCDHRALRELIDSFDAESMREILASEPELRAYARYLDDGDPLRLQGVVAALQQAARELFSGCFGDKGTFSVRSLVRQRGGQVVFICYDPARGEQAASVCGALCELALQEKLSGGSSKGRLFLLLDDFCLLPRLKRLETALALGRNQNVSLCLAASGVEAVENRYGEQTPSLLSAIGVTVAFRLRDRKSRDYVKGLYGWRRAVETWQSTVPMRGMLEQAVDEHVISDEDLTALQTGESLIAMQHYPPFSFRLKPYGK